MEVQTNTERGPELFCLQHMVLDMLHQCFAKDKNATTAGFAYSEGI